ncbi:hypothetical protein, partial [Salmonella enterica]|uniref:hypothetical protein n=1 Tax=Salmonella enterica TaxID=28901 RepID=UPI001C99CFC4
KKHSAQPRKVGNFWILGIKKTSVEVHLYAFGAKAGLKSSCNTMKNNKKTKTALRNAPFCAPTIYFDVFKLN